MKIAISNIAFKDRSLKEVLPILKKESVYGIEIAPALIWDEPTASSKKERSSFRNFIEDHGIKIIGLHAILYNKMDLKLFGSKTEQECFLDYLQKLMKLCADLGGELIIFGAAKNRKRHHIEYERALSIASGFFKKAAKTASDEGVILCIEPLSVEYSCDFINTTDEADDLLSLVNHNNFGLLLDTGVMTLNNEPYTNVIKKYQNKIVHFHVNDPYLSTPGSTGVNHSMIGKALRNSKYNNWITIEMQSKYSSLENIIQYVKKCYLC